VKLKNKKNGRRPSEKGNSMKDKFFRATKALKRELTEYMTGLRRLLRFGGSQARMRDSHPRGVYPKESGTAHERIPDRRGTTS